MNNKTTKSLSLALAGMLQILPMVRSVLPGLQALASSPSGALILRWAVGGVAYFGYHAVSSASSLAISPPTAYVGVPYSGTLTYSGGHAGSVRSMSIAGNCLGSYSIAPGLTVTYSGSYTANVSGTPSGSIGTVPITATVWDLTGCTGGLNDTRSTSLIIQNSGGGPVAPSFLNAPQSTVAQVGSDVVLSGGAGGNPSPQYYWKQGPNFIAGATNNTLTLHSVQLTNGGLYTLEASNASGTALSTCYLSVALTPGSNILTYHYTNYVVASTTVILSSLITNVPAASDYYQWLVGFGTNTPATVPGSTNANLTLTAAQTIPSKSGTYAVSFSSTNGSTVIVSGQQYPSSWMFGYLPVVSTQPSPTTVGSGSNATFSVTLSGSSYPTLLLYQNATNLVAQTNLATWNPSTVSSTTPVSLTLTNVTSSNAGSYTFVVTNFWGSTTSSAAQLTVTPALSVSAPHGQTNYVGKNVSLSVTPTGTAPFTYQWQKGSLNLSNGGAISGATTNILTINPAATGNSGNYQVIVSNTSGSVTSAVATVSIMPVPKFGLSLGTTNVALSATGGVVGSNYVVQVSTNLADPLAWTSIKTNTVPSSGAITFTDTNSPASGQRYYRVQFP